MRCCQDGDGAEFHFFFIAGWNQTQVLHKKKKLGKKVPWTVRGKPKILWPAPTDIRHSFALQWGLIWWGVDYRQPPLWLGLDGWLSPRGSNWPTKPDHDKDGETDEWRTKQVAERNKHGAYFPAGIQKAVKKRDCIVYFFKSQIQMSLLCWFALFECCGLSPSLLLHYPWQKALTDPWHQSQLSFTHLCSHWERTVIKLLIAWIFLCVFATHV